MRQKAEHLCVLMDQVDTGHRCTFLNNLLYQSSCIIVVITEKRASIIISENYLYCIATFSNIDNTCSFCDNSPESLFHLFYYCGFYFGFWKQLKQLITNRLNISYIINVKQLKTYFSFDDLNC